MVASQRLPQVDCRIYVTQGSSGVFASVELTPNLPQLSSVVDALVPIVNSIRKGEAVATWRRNSVTMNERVVLAMGCFWGAEVEPHEPIATATARAINSIYSQEGHRPWNLITSLTLRRRWAEWRAYYGQKWATWMV